MVGFILWLLIAGLVARLLVPGRDPMGILGTILLGIVGSFIGGFLGYVLFGIGRTAFVGLLERLPGSRDESDAVLVTDGASTEAADVDDDDADDDLSARRLRRRRKNTPRSNPGLPDGREDPLA